MKVILMKDVSKLGQRGTVVEVADGYAINVLIKKGLAVLGTPGEIMKWKQKEESTKHKKELQTNTFLQLINKINNTKIEITGKKHDDKGQLFASIHGGDIADAIYKATNLSIDPKQIIIDGHIKSLGEYKVKIKQGGQVEEIKIVVS